MIDHYQILGVGQQGSFEEIQRAYREQAGTFHPDFNPGNRAAAEHFKRIVQAYKALSDDASRREYDCQLDAWLRSHAYSPPPDQPSPAAPPPPVPPDSPFQPKAPPRRPYSDIWTVIRGFVTIFGACVLIFSVVGIGIVLFAAMFDRRRNFRPTNYCGSCGYSWAPRGHYVSRACPHCRSANVLTWTSVVAASIGNWSTLSVASEGFGWVAAGMLVMVAIPLVFIQNPNDQIIEVNRTDTGYPEMMGALQSPLETSRETMPSGYAREERLPLETEDFFANPSSSASTDAASTWQAVEEQFAVQPEHSPNNNIPFPPSDSAVTFADPAATSKDSSSTQPSTSAEDLSKLSSILKSAANPSDRLAALAAIAKLSSSDGSAIVVVSSSLEDASPEIRQASARLLGEFGSNATAAIPGLARRIREDTDDNVRGEAGRAMMKIDPACEQVRDMLTWAIVGGAGFRVKTVHGGQITKNRIWACDAIASIGPPAHWSESLLRELVTLVGNRIDVHGNSELLEKAIVALIEIKANNSSTLAVMKRLRDGKGIGSSQSDRWVKVKILADSCAKGIEAARK